jgi:hypothetical protein
MNVKLLTGVILAVLTVVFIIQNTAVMELKFLFWTLSMSGALIGDPRFVDRNHPRLVDARNLQSKKESSPQPMRISSPWGRALLRRLKISTLVLQTDTK